MTDSGPVLATLSAGARFAIQYNPLAAAASSALAAALAGSPRVRRARRWPSAVVLLAGWLAGDGPGVLSGSLDLATGRVGRVLPGAPAWTGWAVLGIWAVGSLALGYIAPTVLGATVGRRVTHGTGWLAAAAVGSGAALALSAIAAGLS